MPEKHKGEARPEAAVPFTSLEEEVFTNLQRTADELMRSVSDLLKPVGLSPTQYNVLRILRAAGPKGLACGEVAERMITRDPDVTRLLDRLEKRGLVGRRREDHDRRVILTRITPQGLEILHKLDELIPRLHQLQLGHMTEEGLRLMNELLEAARGAVT
jgi:DNA-binding MarR family transcriptional regulator